jgi:hypothetical protein
LSLMITAGYWSHPGAPSFNLVMIFSSSGGVVGFKKMLSV